MAMLPAQLLVLPPVRTSLGEGSRLEPVKRWRLANPDLFEKRRIEGMKKSERVRENLMRLHREKKVEWHKSARKNPKLRATVEHIAAKEWSLKSPTGRVFRFRNLKQFLRGHAEFFDGGGCGVERGARASKSGLVPCLSWFVSAAPELREVAARVEGLDLV